MNRLSFLKKLSTGIAIAVITPRVLADIPDRSKEIDLSKPPYFDALVAQDRKNSISWAKECYARWKEVKPFIYDLCIDRDGRSWMVVSIYEDHIILYALEAESKPNSIAIKESAFSDYFVVLGNVYKEIL